MFRSLETPREWTEHVTEILNTQGVPLVGVSTKETLTGGPPSTYVVTATGEAGLDTGLCTLRVDD